MKIPLYLHEIFDTLIYKTLNMLDSIEYVFKIYIFNKGELSCAIAFYKC